MPALSIQPPYPIFTDTDGQPLENGYVWIGTANQNPITNPIAAYWDAALTVTAAQPVRTLNGYPSNAGTPARLYVNSDYSIQVQNKNGTVVYSAPGATERLSDVVVTGVDSSEVTFLQAGTGAVTRTAQSKLRDIVSVKDFGAVGDGVADDAAAFTAASAAANSILVPIGTYRIGSNITISSGMSFQRGAALRPATSVKVTLTGSVDAGLYQIFDRSGGGAIEFGGSRVPMVYAEWWGARGGVGGRTDNNIPIQHALDAVQSVIYADFTTAAPNDDNNGGEVVLGYSADYLVSGRVHLRNRARIRGQGRFSSLTINNATWGANTEMVLSQNGTSSQFWCSLKDLTLNANENTVITRVVYAPAWQEACGLRDVLIEKFRCHGVYIDTAYGGSVGANLQQVQFFPSSSSAAARYSVYVDVPFTSGVFNLLLEEVSFGGWLTASPPAIDLGGVFAKGRVRIQCRGVHVEGYDYGVTLDTDASLYGLLGATGNSSVNSVVACESTWTGQIDCLRINKGGAVRLVRSFAASPTNLYRDAEPLWGRVIYPHDPTQVLAYARNTAAGGTLDSNAWGFSSISRSAAGQYRLNFDTTKIIPASGTSYRVRVDISDFAGGGRTYYVATQTTTHVDLVFRNSAGANTDCDSFDVCLFGRPGI
jgi:hypothetical protein